MWKRILSNAIKTGLFFLAAYGLIAVLYWTNRPFVADAEWKNSNEINLTGLRPGADLSPLTEMLKGRPYHPRILKEFLRYYEALNRQFPEQPQVLGLLGFWNYQAGRYEQAAEFYRRAIVLRPDFFWSHHNLALSYLKTKNYTDAQATATAALNLNIEATPRYMQEFTMFYPPVFMMLALSPYKNGMADLFQEGYAHMRAIMQNPSSQTGFAPAFF